MWIDHSGYGIRQPKRRAIIISLRYIFIGVNFSTALVLRLDMQE